MFESIDLAAHPHDSNRQLKSMEIAAAVLVNAKKTISDYSADQAIVLHQELRKRHMLPKLRDIMNLYNT